MTKENVMLVAGCSHASGSEIDGKEESKYNRQNNFGAVLAKNLGYRNVNIASPGATNSTIARSIIEWVKYEYVPDKMNLFVLCPWTESTRMEIPAENPIWYAEVDAFANYKSKTYHWFHRINSGLRAGDGFPGDLLLYQKFMAENQEYLEIYSANLVLQIQYFLNSKNISYLMCNTMHMFTKSRYIDFYLEQINRKRYIDFLDNDKSFFWYYRNQGYENPKAKYWHHDEIPHCMYAKRLETFIKKRQIPV